MNDILVYQVLIELPISFCMNMSGFNFVHWFGLRNACRQCHSFFLKYAFPHFCKSTRKYIESCVGSKLTTTIFDNNHYLTGGTLVGCVYGNIFKTSDIDIAVNTDVTSIRNVNTLELIYNETHFNKVSHCMLELGYVTSIGKTNLYNVKHATDFVVKQKIFENNKIDHILIKSHISIKEYIESFDFEFCKMTFDGNKLYIANTDSVITMSAVINDEILKTQRNFWLMYNGNSNYVIDSDDKLESRIIKYCDRGFTIIDNRS